MPWLIKDNPTIEEKLFFVHVPRCGGTSLMHHFDVPTKVMEGRSCWGKFGMRLFFHRYKLLESANFPLFTYGNALAILLMIFSLIASGTQENVRQGLWILSIFLATGSFLFFFCLSFVFTAPTIGRFPAVRRSYLMLIHYPLCQFMESIDWCTGTNRTGYMMHLTAQKLLAYGYISVEEMEKVCTLAIVRNPYSRMVSVYGYNKFGSCESFPHFVREWHRCMFKHYRDSGEMDEWYTACHVIPQFEFTHYQGKQVVQSIVKQEELKYLKTKKDTPEAIAKDSTVADLPKPVFDALLGMPHTNARVTKMKWFDYYDQETLDLCYEMYQHDFVVFNYPAILEQRPDLKPPAFYVKEQAASQSTTTDPEAPPMPAPRRLLEKMVRDSSKSTLQNLSNRSASIVRASSRSTSVGQSVRSSMVGTHQELDPAMTVAQELLLEEE